MSSDSDQEFYDACDVTPFLTTTELECPEQSSKPLPKNTEDKTSPPALTFESERPRRWQRDCKIITSLEEDEEASIFAAGTPPESQSSSVDALFLAAKTVPFRVIENDATSTHSATLSTQDRSQKSLSSELEINQEISSERSEIFSESNHPIEDLTHESPQIPEPISNYPEPDVIASTKIVSNLPSNLSENAKESIPDIPLNEESSSQIVFPILKPESEMIPPIAPPRKYRRGRSRPDDDTISMSSVISAPQSRILSNMGMADNVSHTLDLGEAIRGDYIVKAFDSEKSRAIKTWCSEISCIESTSTGDSTSQASTPDRSQVSLGRLPSFSDHPKQLAGATATSPPTINTSSKSIHPNEPEKHLQKEAVKNFQKETITPVASISSQSKSLTDQEILSQVNLTNLDTGESIPLSEADDHIPTALNPLSLHIMKLTNEMTSEDKENDSDDESVISDIITKSEIPTMRIKKKTNQLKKFIGKTMDSAVNKAKVVAHEVSRGKDDKDVFENDLPAQNTMQYVKIKTSNSHKGPVEFDNLMYAQELKGEHSGPVWCMRFSPCGRLLATAGQDNILRVWVLKQAFSYFLDIRTKWNADVKSSPTPSQESLVSQHSSQSSEDVCTLDPNDDGVAPFMPKPFCVYSGHSADVLDLSWSKNYFMLTSSMDKTVRLWHISRKECLCIFKHVDFVTASTFHPKDDRYFISGSLDGKLRLWSIPDKQVVLWNEVEGHPKLITAANFCQNGAFTVIGTYNGRCIFYKTNELKYYTQIHVKSSRGKNSQGKKITGIESLPDEDKLLITSNDSRIRLYDLNVLNVSCKYKGYSNISSQIRAGVSHDGKYIVAGSENQCIYIWKTHHDYSKFSSARKDRNVYWEGVKAHSAVVTCAIFSPHPEHIFNFIEEQKLSKEKRGSTSAQLGDLSSANNGATNKGYVLVSADFNGCIKVFHKKEKPKHSSLPASAIC